MRSTVAILVVVLISIISVVSAHAEVNPDRLKIFASTKYGAVDFLFTSEVEKQAQVDGSDFHAAIREVGFDLISAIGDAAKSATGVQALLIDRINYKRTHSLVVLGVIVDGKFESISFNGEASNPVVRRFMENLAQKSVVALRTQETAGVELLLAKNRPSKGYIGIQVRDPSIEKNEQGPVLNGIDSRGPAALAGLMSGDIIVSIDGRQIEKAIDLVKLVAEHEAGDKLAFQYRRGASVGSAIVELTERGLK